MGKPTELSPSDGSPIRVKGHVKWFSRPKGYGFIASDEVSEDIFVRREVIVEAGYKVDVRQGATIVCDVQRTPKGMEALRVISVSDNRPSENGRE